MKNIHQNGTSGLLALEVLSPLAFLPLTIGSTGGVSLAPWNTAAPF